MRFGFSEREATELIDLGFDIAFYRSANPDLSVLGDNDALSHFLGPGAKERRKTRVTASPSRIAQFVDGLDAPADQQRAILAALIDPAFSAEGTWEDAIVLSQALSTLNGIRQFLVVGDSHSNLYRTLASAGNDILLPIHMLCSGGTALGLGRANTKSNYGTTALARLSAPPVSSEPIFLKFGQVDVEFAYIFRRVKNDERLYSIAGFWEYCRESISSYFRFIESLAGLVDASRIRVCSIFPPTLSDTAWKEGYVNGHIGFLEGDRSLQDLSDAVRELEIPSWRIRTEMHGLYNRMLAEACAGRGLRFVDDFSPMIGDDGLIAQSYIANHSGADHHLHRSTILPFIRMIIAEHY